MSVFLTSSHHGRMLVFLSAAIALIAVCMLAQPGAANAEETGAITYNQENVAVLAQTTWAVSEAADGSVSVAVASDKWTQAAASSTRPYVAFARGGTRFDVGDARLGALGASEECDTFVIRKESASASPDGSSIVFSGKNIGIDDLQQAFSQDGTLCTEISEEQMRSSLEELAATFEDEEIEVMKVVELPELNEQTALTWLEGIAGQQLSLSFFEPGSHTTSLASWCYAQGEENVQAGITGLVSELSGYGYDENWIRSLIHDRDPGICAGLFAYMVKKGYFTDDPFLTPESTTHSGPGDIGMITDDAESGSNFADAWVYIETITPAWLARNYLAEDLAEFEARKIEDGSMFALHQFYYITKPRQADAEVLSLQLDLSRYAGYFEEVNPLDDPTSESYRDFSEYGLHDVWAMDGAGRLWYIDRQGRQYCLDTTFFSVLEHVLNEEPVSDLTSVGAEIVDAITGAEPAFAEDVAFQTNPTLAVKFGGMSFTAYIKPEIKDLELSIFDASLTYTSVMDMHIDVSLKTGANKPISFNKAFGPLKIPIAGPVASIDIYFSVGGDLNLELAITYNNYQKVRQKVNFATGETTVLDEQQSGSGLAIKGKANATLRVFLTLVLNVTLVPVVSVDAGIALSASLSSPSLNNVSSEDLQYSYEAYNGCSELKLDLFAFVRCPSVYDKGKKSTEDALAAASSGCVLQTAVGLLFEACGGMQINIEFLRTTLFSSHMENGIPVPCCTKNGNSFMITEKDVSFDKADVIGRTLTGRTNHPKVIVYPSQCLRPLKEGTEYTVKYNEVETRNENGWGYTPRGFVTVRGIGQWSGTVTLEYSIANVHKEITADMIAVQDVTWSPQAGFRNAAWAHGYCNVYKDASSARYSNWRARLKEGIDYTISAVNNYRIGTATITIRGKGNYCGIVRKNYQVKPYDLGRLDCDAYPKGYDRMPIGAACPSGYYIADRFRHDEYTYTGYPINVVGDSVLAMCQGVVHPTWLYANMDYVVSYDTDNVNVGYASVTLTGIGHYTGSNTIYYRIVQAPLKITMPAVADQTYTGYPIVPPSYSSAYMMTASESASSPSATMSAQSADSSALTLSTQSQSKTPLRSKDYEFSYQNNTNVGTATISATGKGNYKGTVRKTFKIKPAPITKVSVSGLKTKTYSGKAQTQSLTLKFGKFTLEQGRDYRLSYKNNVKAGKATVTIIGKGNYSGTRKLSFVIKTASLEKAKISRISDKTYTGAAQSQSPVVKVGSKTLRKGTDYSLSYKNNRKTGTATVTVTGKGNWSGSKRATFKINKAANTLSLSALTTKITAKDVRNAARSVPSAVSVNKAQGAVSWKISSASPYLSLKWTNGSLTGTVKKGTPKGTYRTTVSVTANGNVNYKAATKTVTWTVVVS